MSKLTDTILRSYTTSTIIAGNADTEAALQKAIASATAFMYCSDERRADLYARLIEAKFVELTGIERRITTNNVIRQWNQDHIFCVNDGGAPDEAETIGDEQFDHKEPTYDATLKKWIIDTMLGEKIARNMEDEEPNEETLAKLRAFQIERLKKDALDNG